MASAPLDEFLEDIIGRIELAEEPTAAQILAEAGVLRIAGSDLPRDAKIDAIRKFVAILVICGLRLLHSGALRCVASLRRVRYAS